MNPTPRVSVIMPAFNEAENLPIVLRSLAAQHLPPSEFEVILVDNGSTDATLAIAHGFDAPFHLVIVQKLGGSIGQLRNYGASLARADTLAFLDSDCFPRPDWLSEALRLGHKDHIWGADYLPPTDATWVGRTWSDFQASLREGPVHFVPSSNLFVDRSTFQRLHGFSEAETSEDVELCERFRKAGLRVIAHPSLAVLHAETPRTLRSFYRQNRWHGKNVLRLFLKQLPSLANLPVVLVTVYTFVAFWLWIAALIVGVIRGQFALACLLAALLILPAVTIAGVKAIRKRRFFAIPQLFVLYQVYFFARAATLVQTPKRNHR